MADYDVFISYARRDGFTTAERLFRDLSESGLKVWWDKGGGIAYGADFSVAIQQGIRSAKHFVVLMTPASAREDGFVIKEIGYALDQGKTPLPLLLIDCSRPIHLINSNYITNGAN